MPNELTKSEVLSLISEAVKKEMAFVQKKISATPLEQNDLVNKNYSDNNVASRSASTSAPTTNQVLQFNGTQWVPATLTSIPTGTIIPYGAATAPSGYLNCDGSAVSRTTYSALFNVVSTTYGTGDGSTTFNVPDLRGRAPIGTGTGTGGGSSGTGLPSGGSALTNRAMAAWLGEEKHALITAELAAHTHGVHAFAPTGFNQNIAGSGTNSGGEISGSPFASDSVGSGTAHNIVQPVMTVNFCIKT